jgi:hypothetical protein
LRNLIAALVTLPTSNANAQSQAGMNRQAAKDFKKLTALNFHDRMQIARCGRSANQQRVYRDNEASKFHSHWSSWLFVFC